MKERSGMNGSPGSNECLVRTMAVGVALAACITSVGCSPVEDPTSTSSGLSTRSPITSGFANKCLNDLHDVTADGNELDITDCNGTDAQSWTYASGTFVGPGNKCMSVAGDNQVPGGVVHLFTCNGTEAEQWKIVGTNIVSTKGLCLDVKGESSADHTPLQVSTCVAGTEGQVWHVGSVTCPAGESALNGTCVPKLAPCTIANGTGQKAFANGAYGACEVTSCTSGYMTSKGACVASTRACTIANGTGKQGLIFDTYGTCVAVACNAGYTIANNACVAKSSARTITACGDITTAGSYVLGNDLAYTANPAGTCLTIHDTANVSLDCQGHEIGSIYTALAVDNVTGFSISNCHAINTGAGYLATNLITISGSHTGTFVSSTVGDTTSNLEGSIQIDTSDHLSFVNNVLDVESYQGSSSFNLFLSNTVVEPNFELPNLASTAFNSARGHDNSFIANSVDGRATPGPDNPNTVGSDDAFVLGNEVHDLIADNAIRREYDCGIEWSENIDQTTIINNRIDSAAANGICAYGAYYSGTSNSTISYNIVTNAPTLFTFDAPSGLVEMQTAVEFTNNRFEANQLASQATYYTGPPYYLWSANFTVFDTPEVWTTLPAVLTNNVFVNNDFGKNAAPMMFNSYYGTIPSGRVIDGGGNRCLTATGMPFVCN